MKQKRMRNTLIVFTMMFTLLAFMTADMYAAKKVKLFKNNAKTFIQQLNKKNFDAADLPAVLGLGNDEDVKLLRARTDFNRVVHHRFQQTYQGIPVWGMQTVVSVDKGKKVKYLTGEFVLEVRGDVGNVLSSMDPKAVLEKVKENHKSKDMSAKWFFENETAGAFIYVGKNGKASLAYVVSFFADNETGNPSRPYHVIDAKNGKTIDTWDALAYADGQGPGGNLKIGQYYYGGATPDYPPFGVTQSGSTCTMDVTDVRTINMNHGTSETASYSFTCPENLVKEINGAYSPLNDAQFFGQVVYDMYQSWYGVPVLPFQLTMRVHYSTNYENAFWNGSSMTFGDGYTTFHPLVSLDVAAHEVAHGFTDNHSDLIYSGESGGINEAYSDMAGEAGEFYMRGSNDFLIGYDIYKAAGQALRYMHDPPLDGSSIDHINDYYSGMDVHYSSGIYNKAFWVLATTTGWDTHKAFDIFTHSNMNYWTPSTGFVVGAENAMQSAIDYGYNCQDVVNAFAVVGISLTCPGPPVADFSGTPLTGGYPLTVQFTDASTAASSWSWDFGDGGSSTAQNPSYTYNNLGTYTVTMTATNSEGSDTATKVDYINVTMPGPPVADFVASSTDIQTFDTITFTDLTTENPTGWAWTFEGGDPATSTAQNPSVTYNTVGTFTVTLTATNPQGTDTETKTAYINVADKPYCGSQGSNFSLEWIGRVQVDDLDNASGATGYSDFTSISENLTGGANVAVSLTPEFASTVYTEYWKIWIDYNGDHDFEDPGEEVFSGVGTSVVSGNFTVQSGINITTRMRVTMKWNAYPTPCETFSYGEVEDYTVVISSGGNLPPTADFTYTTSGLTANFTDASTDPDGTIVGWDWDFGDGNTSTVQNPSHTYAADGTYNVTLTVTDNGGLTDSVTKSVSVSSGIVEMYVYDITQVISKKGKNYTSDATVTIRDTDNNPVANATVAITWSGAVSGSASAVTNASGQVLFKSAKVKSTGPFTITVDNVTHASLTYNSSLNIETSDTASF